MERLTKKFGDKVILPLMPISPYLDMNDLEKFHKCRREYEGFAIKLAEYEDIGAVEEFAKLNKEKHSSDKEIQEFQLGDIAYMIDEDYRFFESEVFRVEIKDGKFYYDTHDCDFEFKDIDDWVFTSELYREVHIESLM